ncbi:MAG TPA: transglycosylase SLT domain-containing protein [Devosia sp.]|nr:transglycosylase SLT domain-containing protein [Devosia sp.]
MGVQPITVPQSLALVLNSAGDKSGVDFDYLLQTAIRESSLNPEAKAPSSSAVGLFQFLDSTWLQVMKQEGPRLGYQDYADAITRDSDGDYVVKDKAKRAEILKLREDPQLAADLAAAFTRSNGAYLQEKFGRMPSPGELYIAHFLGPQGAERLFNAGLENPDQIAAKLFPRQAKANRAIFYAGDHARTIKEVYRALVAKHDGTPDPSFVAQQLVGAPAAEPPRWPIEELPSRLALKGPAFDSLFLAGPVPGTPQPMAAADAIAAFAGVEPPDIAALGYAPLPAPLPLVPDETPPVADAGPVATEDGVPRARILLSSDPNFGNRFLAQLLGQ